MQINRLLVLLFFISGSVLAQNYPDKFTAIEGWTIEGEKQFYSQDNLYDYINGASDFYLGYAFQDLWVVDYKNQAGQLLTLELYRHSSALQAFGIYTEERPQTTEVLPIGAQGFLESGAIFFLANDYYVKVYNGRPEVPEVAILAFANKVADSICSGCGLPDLFNRFPAQGRVNLSERYMPENFMGLSGFNGVCTVNYELADETFRLFVYKENDETCRMIMEKYFKRLDYKKKLKEKTYTFDDPYLGKVSLSYKKGMISGILDAKNPEAFISLLEKM
ncbi:hypothetical protein J1N10_13805 [Carboxylicivirga sp. A043]|uniref:DUF6599 family protein n=1 Tax=Carboxylicivirga litoralis TaxID=2816963 RepID=UPI0021CAE4D4|nr:DUF6599 family protein [Carboxylicivirga sp. A043]MCU4157060.1 hypothetical protein [Carboxylicivirga sp. A043]